MTISTQICTVTLLGNGVTTSFNYGFLIPYQADGVTPAVAVAITDSAGTSTVLSPFVYSIAGVGAPSGGTITYPLSGSPLAAGWTLTITRALDYVQSTAVPNQAFLPHTVEQVADTLTMQIQQVHTEATTATQGPAGAKGDPGGNVMSVGFFTQLGTLTIPTGTDLIQTSGYRQKGVGAGQYINVAAGPATTIRAQSLNGRWFELLSTLNPQVCGAYGDGSSYLITTPDIAANPQWTGVYTVGTEWDTVGMQEAIYAALANVGSTPGNVVWNASANQYSNKNIYVPNGRYRINRKLIASGTGFTLTFEDRNSAVLLSYVANDYCLLFDTLSYFTIKNLSVSAQVMTTSALVGFDKVRGGSRLLTQQAVIESLTVNGNFNATQALVDVNRTAGGSGQADTIIWSDMFLIGCVRDGLYISGQNALAHIIQGGDSQNVFRDDISVNGGSVYINGRNFEPGVSPFNNSFNYVAPVSKFTMGGAPLQIYSGSSAAVISQIDNARNEGTIGPIGFNYLMSNFGSACSDVSSAYTSFAFTPGWVFTGTGALGHTYMVVDDGGPSFTTSPNFGYLTPDAATSTDTVLSFPGQAWTINQWAGYTGRFVYGNAFAVRRGILSNTATTVTLDSSVGTTPGNGSLFRICQTSGSTELTWSTVPNGFYAARWRGGSNAFNATAAQPTITCANMDASFPSVGDYVVIQDGGTVQNVAGSFVPVPVPWFAKVVSTNSGANQFTCDKNVPFAMTDYPGFVGTPATWGGLKIIDLDIDATSGAQDSFGWNQFPLGRVANGIDQKFTAGRPDALRGNRNGLGVPFTRALGAPVLQSSFVFHPGASPHDIVNDALAADLLTWTPTSNMTLTCSSPRRGQELTLIITTAGTVSYTTTFSTGIKSTGTFATGGTSGKVAVIKFVGDGTNFNEVSRTTLF